MSDESDAMAEWWMEDALAKEAERAWLESLPSAPRTRQSYFARIHRDKQPRQIAQP